MLPDSVFSEQQIPIQKREKLTSKLLSCKAAFTDKKRQSVNLRKTRTLNIVKNMSEII